MMKTQYHVKGFTLIEVMLALLILALGILGISKLQGTLIKNTSDANQRAVAVSLAQKKIDDLRSFAQLDLTGTSDWACPGPGQNAASLAYADISDNSGGAPLCASDLISNTNIEIGNTNYQLSWDATPYHFVSNVATAMDDASSAAPTVDFKEVEITVSWLDIATGNDASVAVSTIVDSYNPALTSLAGTTSAGGESIYPTYTPEAAPDVIDVDVETGGNTRRQTSKPLPDAVKTGQDANTIVSFEVVTYTQNPLDNTKFTPTRQEEYVTVDCSCTFNGEAYTYPPAHVVWDVAEQDRYDYVGSPILKQTATQTNNANDADELCVTCCRDHHDSPGSTVKYNNNPKNADGNHIHYQTDGVTEVSPGDSTPYLESCRMKLVDGIYRVFQDWKLYDITTLDREALATNADNGGVQDTYSDYVSAYVLNQSGVASPAASKPDAVTDLTTSVGEGRQIQARGIYIDQVYDLDGNVDPLEYTSYIQDSPVNDDRLEKIPFTEVNLTLLANWESDDETKVTVTDEDVATIPDEAADYYGVYSRGYIQNIADTGGSEVLVDARITDSNNGLTQITNDADSTPIEDAISITTGVGAIFHTIEGTYSFTFAGAGEKIDTTRSNCTVSTGQPCILHGKNPPTYSGNEFETSVPDGSNGIVTLNIFGTKGCSGTETYTFSNISSNKNAGNLTGTCN